MSSPSSSPEPRPANTANLVAQYEKSPEQTTHVMRESVAALHDTGAVQARVGDLNPSVDGRSESPQEASAPAPQAAAVAEAPAAVAEPEAAAPAEVAQEEQVEPEAAQEAEEEEEAEVPRGAGIAMLRRASTQGDRRASVSVVELEAALDETAPAEEEVAAAPVAAAEEEEPEARPVPVDADVDIDARRGSGVAMLRRASASPVPAVDTLDGLINDEAEATHEAEQEGGETTAEDDVVTTEESSPVLGLRMLKRSSDASLDHLNALIDASTLEEAQQRSAEEQQRAARDGLRALVNCMPGLDMIQVLLSLTPRELAALTPRVVCTDAVREDDIDTDSEGEEDVAEFEDLRNLRISEDALKDVFMLFDSDCSGALDAYDCQAALRSMALTPRALPQVDEFSFDAFRALVSKSNHASDSIAEMRKMMSRHGNTHLGKAMVADDIIKALGSLANTTEVEEVLRFCSQDRQKMVPTDLRKLR